VLQGWTKLREMSSEIHRHSPLTRADPMMLKQKTSYCQQVVCEQKKLDGAVAI
jgi:hypothetical protein